MSSTVETAHKDKTKKKTHGIFYTPDSVASLLCDWAIQAPTDKVLEPSFGGCGFLRAICERFRQLQVPENDVFQHIYGSDIDAAAFEHLSKILPYSNGHFRNADFLTLNIADFPLQEQFDVIAGNPPYVSHHNLLADQKETAWSWLGHSPFSAQIDKRASLWVYFVLHSLSFLKPGGRIVWVLPSSFLYADYAAQVREILQQRFARMLGIVIGERLFIDAGTEEISVFVLGEHYQPDSVQSGEVSFAYATSSHEVPQLIQRWTNGSLKTQAWAKDNFLPRCTLTVLQRLPELTRIVSLGDICDIHIGVVSGANKFFILKQSDWKTHGLPEEVKTYILARFRYTQGLCFTEEDLLGVRDSDNLCMLLDTTQTDTLSPAVEAYLAHFPPAGLKAATFRRRQAVRPWYEFNDNAVPDAFLPYMNNDGPRIVLNLARVNSTNSIHRLYFKPQQTALPQNNILMQKQASISSLSTFTQLSAELQGRVYGAGVLKHELSEAKNIQLILPLGLAAETIENTFCQVDAALRSQNLSLAQSLADNFVLACLEPKIRQKYQKALQQGLLVMRSNRAPRGKGNVNDG